MGRPGLTQSEIYHAAQLVISAGKIPTVQSVRNLLGSGSTSTIHKHLQAWKKQRLIQEDNKCDLPKHEQNFVLERENINLKNKLNNLIRELQAMRRENLALKEQINNSSLRGTKRWGTLLWNILRFN